MLDTIAIKLERHSYKIHHPSRFSPNAALMNDSRYTSKGIMRAIYNPTMEEKQQGYLPKLTLFKKPYGEWSHSVWLKVEFSAPKLVFGNNFEELAESDFEKVIESLQMALNRMGVEVTQEALIESGVTAIHYSKNILMDRHTPCFLVLQMLEKADVSVRLDVSKSLFRNYGQMVSYHAKNFEVVFYDKIRDMEQARKFGEGRGAEKDYNDPFLHRRDVKRSEVLRMEVRLLSKKLKSLLDIINVSVPLTLNHLFCAQISRSVLLHYWNEIVNGLYALNIEATACDDVAESIRATFPKKRPCTVLALMGFVQTCQQVGPRGARLLLGLSDSQFYKLRAEAKKLGQNLKGWRFVALGKVRLQLDGFVPLSLIDWNEGRNRGFLDHYAQARA